MVKISAGESGTVSLLHGPQPVVPRNVSILYENRLVFPMVADPFEEDAAPKQ